MEIIYRVTLFVAMPSAIGTFYTLYLANTQTSVDSGSNTLSTLPPWCGFIVESAYPLEYMITFVYTFLIALMLRVTQNRLKKTVSIKKRRARRNANTKRMSISENLGVGKIIFAFIVSYSFYISLFVLYWIGLSQVNLFHFGLTLFFVTFVVNPKIVSRYWKFLVFYICVAIFLR